MLKWVALAFASLALSSIASAQDMVPTGQPVVATGEVGHGDVIVAIPTRPSRVGRLRENLIDQSFLGGNSITLRAGTPVYRTTFHYVDVSRYGNVRGQTFYEAWCGVVPEQVGRRNPRAYCALRAPGINHLSPVLGGSPYWRPTLFPPLPANAVTIEEDPAVLAEFPRLEVTYTFVEFDEHDADLRIGSRINGGRVVEVEDISVPSNSDGSSVLRVAGVEIWLTRGSNRRTAFVDVVTPDAPPVP